MPRRISVGIDIGSHNTRVIIAEAGSSPLQPRILGTGTADTDGLRRGYITNTAEAAGGIRHAIAQAERTAKIKVKDAFIGVGGVSLQSSIGVGTVSISRIDQVITQQDVEKAIAGTEKNVDLRNREMLHRIPLEFKIDGKEVLGRPAGMVGGKLEARALYVTCLDQHLDDLVTAIEQSGIRVLDVVASPIAASVVALTKPQRTAGCMLLNIGAETVSAAVYENNVLISLKVFPFGSLDITKDIALGLKIPLEEAEGIKKGSITDKKYPKNKLDEIIGARLQEIFDVIESHLKKLGRYELLPAGIIITGGGSGMASIDQITRSALKLPSRLGGAHTFSSSSFAENLDNSWSVAYGLCILGFDENYRSDYAEFQRSRRVGRGQNPLLQWFKQFLP